MRISDWSSDVCSSDLGRLEAVSWGVAFKAIADRLKGVPGERIAALAGDLCDAESMLALKDLMAGLGSPNLDCRQDGARIDASCRAGYLFNTTIAGIESADAALIVGSNRSEEHTSELQSLMRTSYPVFCLKKTKHNSKPNSLQHP